MQVLQIRIGNTLCHIKSKTKTGVYFIEQKMIPRTTTPEQIKLMIQSKDIELFVTNN